MPTLKAVFEQQVPPHHLKKLFQSHVAYCKQSDLLQALNNADAPHHYKCLILKQFIQHIENQSRYLHESINEAYVCMITTSSNRSSMSMMLSKDNIVHYSMNDHIKISIKENPNIICNDGSTGYRTWEAALALLECMISLPARILKAQRKDSSDSALEQLGITFDVLHSLAAVELGAGTGLVGLMYSKLNGHKVALTDGDEGVVAQLENNIQLNYLQAKCRAQKLYWGVDSAITAEPGRQQFVLASDVTYDPSAAPKLVSCIKQFLTTTNTAFSFVSATIRSVDTFNSFILECKKNAIKVVHLAHYTSPFDEIHYFVDENTPDIVVMGLVLEDQSEQDVNTSDM